MGEIKRQALVVGINCYLFKKTPMSEAQHLMSAVQDAESADSPYLRSIMEIVLKSLSVSVIEKGRFRFLAVVCRSSLLSNLVVI